MQAQGAPTDQAGIGPGKSLLKHLAIAAATDLRGPIDPRTGMVCDLAALQGLVDELVVEPFDHTFLNKDVAHFATTVPTAENIALHIADLLSAPIAGLGASLHKVRLQESPNNAAEVFAEVPALGMQPQALEALASA